MRTFIHDALDTLIDEAQKTRDLLRSGVEASDINTEHLDQAITVGLTYRECETFGFIEAHYALNKPSSKRNTYSPYLINGTITMMQKARKDFIRYEVIMRN